MDQMKYIQEFSIMVDMERQKLIDLSQGRNCTRGESPRIDYEAQRYTYYRLKYDLANMIIDYRLANRV